MSAVAAGLLAVLAVLLWGRRPHPWRASPEVEPSVEGAPRLPPDADQPVVRRWVDRVPWRARPPTQEWVADFADLAALALSSGLPTGSAVDLAAARVPGRHALTALFAAGPAPAPGAVDTGESSAESEWAERWPDLAVVVRAWRLSQRTGGSPTRAMTASADLVRSSVAARQRVQVLVAGPRATVRLLSLLPLVGPLIVWVLGLDVTEVYGGGLALAGMVGGCLLTLAGWAWAARILRVAGRPAHLEVPR